MQIPKLFIATCYKRYKNKNKTFVSSTGLRRHTRNTLAQIKTWSRKQISAKQYVARSVIRVDWMTHNHKTNLAIV